MLQLLILYYISIKPTHGYEIQRFIQVHELDKWTKIQSGSIYYALSKLEKNKLIMMVDEQIIGEGGYSRKIYSITDAGKHELDSKIKDCIKLSIYDVGSDKFFMYSFLTRVDRTAFESIITSHINSLNEQKSYLEKWQQVKINSDSLEVENISFEMMLSSISYQIQWHEALINQYDEVMAVRERMEKLITSFDFNRAVEIDPAEITNISNSEKNNSRK